MNGFQGPLPLAEIQEAEPPGGVWGGAPTLARSKRHPLMVTTDTPVRRMVHDTGADYWRLWSVGLAVFTVRWLETVAVGVVVYQRTGSAFVVAMMTMLRLLPMGLFGVFLGALAERFDRRATLIGVVLLVGEVVGRQHMSTAMSLDVGANNASRMVGPTLGGLLLASIGIEGPFALSVLLYLGALAAALTVRSRIPVSAGGSAVLARIAEGLTIVRGDRKLIGTLIVTVIFNVFAWPFTSMIPVIGRDRLLLGPEGVGILAGLDGIGAFAGAMMLALWLRPHWYGRAYVGGVACTC
jgi:MFS family permease